MPWRCPACSTQVQHKPIEAAPRPNVIYRCPVCRLELVLDEHANKLVVAPMTDDKAHS